MRARFLIVEEVRNKEMGDIIMDHWVEVVELSNSITLSFLIYIFIYSLVSS